MRHEDKYVLLSLRVATVETTIVLNQVNRPLKLEKPAFRNFPNRDVQTQHRAGW